MTLHISIVPNPQEILPPPPSIPLYQMGDDFQVLGGARSCASGGCPAVMLLRDAPDTLFDQQWQYFVFAINEGEQVGGMTLSAIIALMGDGKWGFNRTGFGGDNVRANFLTGANLTAPLPRLDKLRTFALNTHTGAEVYSLLFAIQNVFRSVKERSFLALRSALTSFTAANAIQVTTFDGNNPPRLNQGWSYPQSLAEVNLRAYRHTPQTSPELFLDLTNVKIKPGNILSYGPFDHGALRPWLPDGRPHSFFPLVSRSVVLSPLWKWRRVTAFPSPFR